MSFKISPPEQRIPLLGKKLVQKPMGLQLEAESGGCETGSNNTFLGANTQFEGALYISGSITLGEGATVNKENQLMVVSTITSFNISGLTPWNWNCESCDFPMEFRSPHSGDSSHR